jgi:glycosyltransferase involved in cell wall biosynthesis
MKPQLVSERPAVSEPPIGEPTIGKPTTGEPTIGKPTTSEPTTGEPTISVVLTAYNAERYIGQALRAILSQTHPPDEVIVVDDGSTDGTPAELERFGGAVRVVRQDNRGHAAALNRGMSEARGDYLAKCDADDIWEPDKLERQLAALSRHPEIDVALSGARFIGLIEEPRVTYPSAGVLEPRELARRLYTANFVCASSVLIRRRLYRQLGPFAEELACEDYDYWLRALAAGGVFFYDPSLLVRYRVHSEQLSQRELHMREAVYRVHGSYAGLVGDPRLVRKVQAVDLFEIARLLVDRSRPREARALFVSALRHRPTPRALAWVLILSTPVRLRRPLAERVVSIKRTAFPAAPR